MEVLPPPQEGEAPEDGGAGPPSFQVGLESSSERLHELQFSLVHHVAGSRHEQEASAADLEEDLVHLPAQDEAESGDSRHRVHSSHSQRTGTDLIAAEIEAYVADGHQDVLDAAGGGPESLDIGDVGPNILELEDGLSGMIMPGIQRMDSRDVVFDNRQKRAKVLAGRYVMGDVLGEGAYAKVKEAVDQETLCRRAVKIMKRKKLRKVPHGEENVKSEIKLLHRLRHKNVMRLIEVLYNDEKGKIYLVLEYCCAVLKDMLDHSHGKRFPAWQAHFYFKQLTDGLEYLHNTARVVHKDIKPANLLLDTAGVLKIADFGTAEQLDPFSDGDDCVTSQGTPAFQPPEIAAPTGSGDSEAFSGFKLDVWSSGITLFNFITGDYPFTGDTIFRLFEDIARCEYEVPRDLVDPVLESLIRGMLTRDPAERLTLLKVREHDWMRKKHPCSSPPVTVRPRDGDPTLSTTVIPYLCDLHYGSQFLNDGGGEGVDGAEGGGGGGGGSQLDFVTEHDLHEMQRRKEEGDGGGGGEGDPEFVSRGSLAASKRKEKTTKCIKVRKISGCVVS